MRVIAHAAPRELPQARLRVTRQLAASNTLGIPKQTRKEPRHRRSSRSSCVICVVGACRSCAASRAQLAPTKKPAQTLCHLCLQRCCISAAQKWSPAPVPREEWSTGSARNSTCSSRIAPAVCRSSLLAGQRLLCPRHLASHRWRRSPASTPSWRLCSTRTPTTSGSVRSGKTSEELVELTAVPRIRA